MQILKLAKLSKDIKEILFLSLFMHSRDKYNPALNCCNNSAV